jgi:hypothetical protein
MRRQAKVFVEQAELSFSAASAKADAYIVPLSADLKRSGVNGI